MSERVENAPTALRRVTAGEASSSAAERPFRGGIFLLGVVAAYAVVGAAIYLAVIAVF